MAVLKSERGALVATLFVRNYNGAAPKKHHQRPFLAPGVPSRDQKGSGNQVREPGEDPKGPEVHPGESPGRPRRGAEDQFGGCGNLETLSFMLRKSMVFDLGDFASSGRSRDPPRERPGDPSVPFCPHAPLPLHY